MRIRPYMYPRLWFTYTNNYCPVTFCTRVHNDEYCLFQNFKSIFLNPNKLYLNILKIKKMIGINNKQFEQDERNACDIMIRFS